jgi:predicted metalloprotease
MRIATALILLVALALGAGCGTSDSSGSGTTATAAAGTTARTTAATTATTATTGTRPSARPRSPIESADAQKMTSAIALPAAPDPASADATRADAAFLRAAFDSAQELWRRQFAAAGAQYESGHLVLFHTQVHTPCGVQSAETGPFYCPPAAAVYLNTDFFDALAQQHGLQSGWAAGYVTAHEVAHHVQTLLGVLQRNAALEESDPAGANARSVLVELQADCYAGVWLHELDGAGALSEADLQDIVRAAAIVGDDFQRNQAGRALEPETWTHGSSEQRVRWLTTGLRSGRPADCDTFSSSEAGHVATGATPPSTTG